MRVSAVISLLSWLSVLAMLWLGLFRVLYWDLASWVSLAAFLAIGLLAGGVSGRYGAKAS